MGSELCTSINLFLVVFSRTVQSDIVGTFTIAWGLIVHFVKNKDLYRHVACIAMACKQTTKQLVEHSPSGLNTQARTLDNNMVENTLFALSP